MITEDYVSFEIAKLLKEKGFVLDNITMLIGNDNKPFLSGNSGYEYLLNLNCEVYPVPTLQMAMKWLREVYKLYVFVIPNPLNYQHQDIQDGWACEVVHLSDLSYDGDYEFFQKKYQTYESACEAAIKYCLENLI